MISADQGPPPLFFNKVNLKSDFKHGETKSNHIKFHSYYLS